MPRFVDAPFCNWDRHRFTWFKETVPKERVCFLIPHIFSDNHYSGGNFICDEVYVEVYFAL